jgi:hypothetical protein
MRVLQLFVARGLWDGSGLALHHREDLAVVCSASRSLHDALHKCENPTQRLLKGFHLLTTDFLGQ